MVGDSISPLFYLFISHTFIYLLYFIFVKEVLVYGTDFYRGQMKFSSSFKRYSISKRETSPKIAINYAHTIYYQNSAFLKYELIPVTSPY